MTTHDTPAKGKIDHTDCYAAKLHPATTAGRSLCRTLRSEGKALTKASFSALAKRQAAAKAARKKPVPKAEPATDDPYDESDAVA